MAPTPFRCGLLVLLLLPIAAPLATGQSTGPDIIIAELMSDPGSEREFIELWNRGDVAINLTGWTIRDLANNTFTFPAWNLVAGGRVVVWGGGASDASGPAWTKATVWNNGGDTAYLRNATGTLIDSFAYGSSPAAPATGKSLALIDGSWREGEPTPGRAPGVEGGTATASVIDVPPEVSLLGVPSHARSGSNIGLVARIDEPNGDAITWSLVAGATILASGSSAGDHDVVVSVPLAAGPWTLTLSASDAGGQSRNTSANISVHETDLAVLMPGGPITFPALEPGQRNVSATQPFTLRNLADAPRAPRLDVSPFVAGSSSIPVEDNLRIGTRSGGGPWTWTPYTGPLTLLPAVPSGAEVEVLLEIIEVPRPLAAGLYGTSFTVVA
jgi:hypothetical protein